MPDHNRTDELPIIRAYYELILWMMPKVGKFSREHRFTLGQRMELLLYEVLEKLIRARYTRDRRSILESVNIDLEVLRFQIRLARDLNCLSVKSYGTGSYKLLHIGRDTRVVASWRPQFHRVQSMVVLLASWMTFHCRLSKIPRGAGRPNTSNVLPGHVLVAFNSKCAQ